SETGGPPNPFRLRGQYHDAETGLYYNYYRHYDPALGDYTAPDPIGLEGGHHFYAYPRNPLRWDDPFGLKCNKPECQDKPAAEEQKTKQGSGPAALDEGATPTEGTSGRPRITREDLERRGALVID